MVEEITPQIDFPTLFQSANDASIFAHKKDSDLVKAQIILLVLAAATGSILITREPYSEILLYATVFLLGASIITAWLMRVFNYRQTWYHCRAIAESVKKLCWLYMMRAGSFADLDEVTADNMMISELQEITQRNQMYCSYMCDTTPSTNSLEKMRLIRRLDFNSRKRVYLEHRLNDQISWYSGKAKKSKFSSDRFKLLMFISEIAAIVGVIAVVRWANIFFKPVGLFVNIALGILSWTEYNRYEQLARSYQFTSLNLEFTAAKILALVTESEFSNNIIEIESVIEIENRMWLDKS